MNILKLAKTGLIRSGHFLKKHAPTILTAVGIGGSISSVIFAIKATPTAMKLIEERKQREQKEKLTALETVDTCWKIYIPMGATLATAIGCMVGANCLSLRRQAALLGLYSAQGELLKNYKEKVVEALGQDEEKAIAKGAATETADQKVVKALPAPKDGEELYFDTMTGQFFVSSPEKFEIAKLSFENSLFGMIDSFTDGGTINDWLEIVGENTISDGYMLACPSPDLFDPIVTPGKVKGQLCYNVQYDPKTFMNEKEAKEWLERNKKV